MNDSIGLGTLRGIRVGMHWSVALIGWLLAWGLATRVLPAAAPGAGAAAYWATGIGIAILFFGSLLAHELAHAVFAQRAGLRVDGITLWLLGGVARLDGDAPTPAHDLRIAASGPVTSALLGVGFLAAAAALAAMGAHALLVEAAAWLARVNLVLAAFNLLPGAPLDGGRIVRAIAWRLGRDRLRASLVATRLGRALGFGLVTFGLFELVVGSDLGGIWTIVIGLFMTGAAAAEGRQEVLREALDGLRVRDVMSPDPVYVPAGITVDVFVEGVLVAQGRTAALVVEAGGVPFGVAGLGEVARLRGRSRREVRLREIAIPHTTMPVVGPDEEVLAALERLDGPSAAPYLLVIDAGQVVGLVSGQDVARSVARSRASRGDQPAAPATRRP